MAADIESLIRQALAKQNGFDPAVRQKIYQSSRNALAKLIAKSGAMAPEAIQARNAALEQIINKIESEFTANIQSQTSAQTQVFTQESPAVSEQSPPPAYENSPDQQQGQASGSQLPPEFLENWQTQARQEPNHYPQSVTDNIAGPDSEYPAENQRLPDHGVDQKIENYDSPSVDEPLQNDTYEPVDLDLGPRRQKSKRWMIWLALLVLFVLMAWLAYLAAKDLMFSEDTSNPQSNIQQAQTLGNGITILDPADPTSLETANRGKIELMEQGQKQYLRLISVRGTDSKTEPALPILLQLAPGVLTQIAGKKATVEILAKSGEASPITFAVACNFGDLGQCTRKRFRIGLQPEAIVFPIEISSEYREGQTASLALSTDVSKSANLTGEGSKLDILGAKLSLGSS